MVTLVSVTRAVVLRALPVASTPPTTRIVPEGRSVAEWRARGVPRVVPLETEVPAGGGFVDGGGFVVVEPGVVVVAGVLEAWLLLPPPPPLHPIRAATNKKADCAAIVFMDRAIRSLPKGPLQPHDVCRPPLQAAPPFALA